MILPIVRKRIILKWSRFDIISKNERGVSTSEKKKRKKNDLCTSTWWRVVNDSRIFGKYFSKGTMCKIWIDMKMYCSFPDDIHKIEILQGTCCAKWERRVWTRILSLNIFQWYDEEMCKDVSVDQDTDRLMTQNENEIYFNRVWN